MRFAHERAECRQERIGELTTVVETARERLQRTRRDVGQQPFKGVYEDDRIVVDALEIQPPDRSALPRHPTCHDRRLAVPSWCEQPEYTPGRIGEATVEACPRDGLGGPTWPTGTTERSCNGPAADDRLCEMLGQQRAHVRPGWSGGGPVSTGCRRYCRA